MSAEPIIVCPKCRAAVPLTSSLTESLFADTRRQYEDKLAQQSTAVEQRDREIKTREETLARERETLDATVAEKMQAERTKLAADTLKRDQALAAREAALAKEKESVDTAVAEKLRSERAKITADEARKAKLAASDELEQKTSALQELQANFEARGEKLAEAQKAQADFARKERELADKLREADLMVETRINESLGKERASAKKEAEEALSLKLGEKDIQLASMQRTIEELKKKAEQGSQQLQGEALELQLETILAARFPHDSIEPVAKGEHGGDILQRVTSPTGTRCGTILWETKRTKNWSDSWLGKLREDQRQAKAEIAIIASSVLPKDCEHFDQKDGVWVVHPKCLIPLAMTLRHQLMEVSTARTAGEGQQTKMEMMYGYLTGPKFRLRVQAIVEAFSTMSDDLHKEKKAAMKQWAKREEQLHRVMEATVGMYGEMQAIAGRTLSEIEGLDLLVDETIKEGV